MEVDSTMDTNSNPLILNGNGSGLHSERVVILDAGAQYGKVIDRRVRELQVESVMLPLDTPASQIHADGFRAILISGGPGSVSGDTALSYDPTIFDIGIPVLGICYGFQMINKHFGGDVEKKDLREDGQFTIKTDTSSRLFAGLSESEDALLTHGDSLTKLAPDFKAIAYSGKTVVGISDESRKIYGVQFHPEVDLTTNGRVMMKNFLRGVTGLHGTFSMKCREQECIEHIRSVVGDKKVLMLVSGGVDSTVCAALLRKALSDEQVIAFHIDNGFMRKDESAVVEVSLRNIGLKLRVINAGPQFYNSTTTVPVDKRGDPNKKRLTKPLCLVVDPEEKRRIIGDTFMKISQEIINDLKLDPEEVMLGQGTLRPDLIESASALASNKADAIKTHHNDTALVRELRAKGRVVEPLKDFHKDEVRILGTDLGLPRDLVQRHPFPGPGLAVRVICAEEPYMEKDFSETLVLVKVICNYSDSLEKKHALLNRIQNNLSSEELQFLQKLPNSFTITPSLLPIRSVGVQGDCRTFSYVVVLTFATQPQDWTDVMRLAKIIPRACHNVNRVCYAFGPPITFPVSDITPTYLTPQVLSTLREADWRTRGILEKAGMTEKISQMPVILIPVHFDRDVVSRQPSCQFSIVIRTFITEDFMTGIPAQPNKHIPIEVLNEMVKSLDEIPGLSRVLYDLTPKPPGTTEWE